MDSVEGEGENARLFLRGADDLQTRNAGDGPRGVLQEPMLVLADRFHAYRIEVVNRRGQPVAPRDVGSPRLELVGYLIVRGFLKRDGADHVPASLIRRHLLQMFRLSVQDADAGRSEHLVS